MSDNSRIEWTQASWNFIHGCTRVSEGCLRCYIDKQPPFRQQRNFFDSKAIGGSTRIVLMPHKLELPTTWRKPRRVFVNSLSDLFHKQVPTDLIARAFAVMLRTPQHSYQILTKRPGRMRALLNSHDFRMRVISAYAQQTGSSLAAFEREHGDGWWPLRNVWLGVSVEDQRWADVRIPLLARTPAAVRFLSCEPLLSEIRITRRHAHCPTHDFAGGFCTGGCPDLIVPDWGIIGGESGPGARPMELDWVRSLLSDFRVAGIAPFVKQLGAQWARANRSADPKGGLPEEWPLALRHRQFPKVVAGELVAAPERAAVAA